MAAAVMDLSSLQEATSLHEVAAGGFLPKVRLWAARHVSPEILRRLARDRSANVRPAAWERLVAAGPVSADLAVAGLLDPCPAVRAMARGTGDVTDPAAWYREAVAAERALPASLAGLAEVGDRADACLVGRFLGHSLPSVRSAALSAVARLDGDAYVEDFLEALLDPSPRVSRTALRILQRGFCSVPPSVAWEQLGRAASEHARRNALTLIADLDRWEALPCLLEATRQADSALRTQAQAFLRRWLARCNRCFTGPTAHQKGAARDSLELALLDPDLASALRSVL